MYSYIMIRLLCFSVVVAIGLAIPTPGRVCKVSEWSDWSSCRLSKLCQPPGGSTSFPMEEALWDAGRVKMQYMMKRKQELREERDACIQAGECPDLYNIDSEGFAPCIDGLANTWPCRNIDLLSFLNIEDLGYTDPLPGDSLPEGNDIWGWHDDQTGDEYAMIGLSGGTSFVRVTDPYNPVVLGFLESHTGPSIWRDLKVFNNYVFIVSEASNHGLQVYDLNQLRGKEDFSMLEETNHYPNFGNAHNIAVNTETGYVYVVGATQSGGYTNCRGGLHIVDVNDPANPQFTGCFDTDGYTHDTECVIYHGPDTRYTGHEICFGYNENSLTIIDVTDHVNPTMISKRGYTNSRYTHQGWITEDHTIVLLDDELDEMYTVNKNTATFIWDVTNLEEPELKRTFYSSETSIDHNQYILGDLTYQSNYEAGLRILYIDQANYDLEEVAYFDVLPHRTSVNFAGTWSNYPYYKDGFVAVSSIDYGLFLLKPNYAAINGQIAARKSYAEQTRTRHVEFAQPGAKCPHRVETMNCDPDTAC